LSLAIDLVYILNNDQSPIHYHSINNRHQTLIMLNHTNRILVVGDVMLDRYWKGTAARLSPEAPVPVVNVAGIENRLGGAANVALNLSCLGAKVALCGLVGTDPEANIIRQMIADAGIEDHLVVGTDSYVTVQKIRIIAQNQQIVRADFERQASDETLVRLTRTALNQIESARTVIFSDYKKGALGRVDELIAAARRNNALTLIDPKGSNYAPYTGATVLTPNLAELAAVMGPWKSEKELLQKAETLRSTLKLDKLLLTRSEEGMTLFESGGHTHFPTEALEVFDVSGAGDTVIATLALMLTEGKSWHDAVQTANRAAGIVVGRFGTAAVTAKDLGL
jgi:rfaE bifunctional protein kinase chain/domain